MHIVIDHHDSAAIPEDNLDPITTFRTEHHHHPRLGRKVQLDMRHGCKSVVPLPVMLSSA